MRDPASWYIRSELQALVADFAKNPRPINGLVVGPPGSGKTTVVRQAASNASLELVEIPASVLASDSPETVEARLQAIFIKAARTSCVLFLDDIDYWFPKSLSSAQEFHLLAVLCDLLEQIREEPQAPVAFIATASHHAEIHPSLTSFTEDQDFPLHVVRVQPLSENERRLIFCDLFGAITIMLILNRWCHAHQVTSPWTWRGFLLRRVAFVGRGTMRVPFIWRTS